MHGPHQGSRTFHTFEASNVKLNLKCLTGKGNMFDYKLGCEVLVVLIHRFTVPIFMSLALNISCDYNVLSHFMIGSFFYIKSGISLLMLPFWLPMPQSAAGWTIVTFCLGVYQSSTYINCNVFRIVQLELFLTLVSSPASLQSAGHCTGCHWNLAPFSKQLLLFISFSKQAPLSISALIQYHTTVTITPDVPLRKGFFLWSLLFIALLKSLQNSLVLVLLLMPPRSGMICRFMFVPPPQLDLSEGGLKPTSSPKHIHLSFPHVLG